MHADRVPDHPPWYTATPAAIEPLPGSEEPASVRIGSVPFRCEGGRREDHQQQPERRARQLAGHRSSPSHVSSVTPECRRHPSGVLISDHSRRHESMASLTTMSSAGSGDRPGSTSQSPSTAHTSTTATFPAGLGFTASTICRRRPTSLPDQSVGRRTKRSSQRTMQRRASPGSRPWSDHMLTGASRQTLMFASISSRPASTSCSIERVVVVSTTVVATVVAEVVGVGVEATSSSRRDRRRIDRWRWGRRLQPGGRGHRLEPVRPAAACRQGDTRADQYSSHPSHRLLLVGAQGQQGCRSPHRCVRSSTQTARTT